MGTRVPPVRWGIEERLAELFPPDQRPQIRQIGLEYPAADVSWSKISSGEFHASIWEGVYALYELLVTEHERCPGERIVLAGYSQGALAIHLALSDLAVAEPIPMSAIAGVALIADPARLSDGSETFIGGAASHAHGVYTTTDATPSIPAAVTLRTISLCHKNDVVCAIGSGALIDAIAGADQHTRYSITEGVDLGVWITNKMNG
jgi:cutinase